MHETAICAIEWTSEGAFVELPAVGLDEAAVLDAMRRADWIGIDAPFGWPEAMVKAIHDYAHGRPWPDSASPESLRYRATDWFVHDVIAKKRGKSVWPFLSRRIASRSARGAARNSSASTPPPRAGRSTALACR